jgi:hypothetical protein
MSRFSKATLHARHLPFPLFASDWAFTQSLSAGYRKVSHVKFDALMTADVSLWSEVSDIYRFSPPALQPEKHRRQTDPRSVLSGENLPHFATLAIRAALWARKVLLTIFLRDSESQPRPLLSISGNAGGGDFEFRRSRHLWRKLPRAFYI